LNDPQFIGYLRIAYVGSQALALLVYYFITMKVSRLSLDVRHSAKSQIRRRNDLTVLKYVNPPSATVSTVSTTRVVHSADVQDPEGKPELVTTTVKDYDLAETGKAMKSLFMGVAMMCFLVSPQAILPSV
jgi:hypothetical protein